MYVICPAVVFLAVIGVPGAPLHESDIKTEVDAKDVAGDHESGSHVERKVCTVSLEYFCSQVMFVSLFWRSEIQSHMMNKPLLNGLK